MAWRLRVQCGGEVFVVLGSNCTEHEDEVVVCVGG